MSMRILLIIGALAALILPASVTAAEPRAGAPGNQAPAVKRTILRRVDVPNSNYEVVLVIVEVPADTSVGRHTHPGTVVGYVIEGEYTMLIDGRPPQALNQGKASKSRAASYTTSARATSPPNYSPYSPLRKANRSRLRSSPEVTRD